MLTRRTVLKLLAVLPAAGAFASALMLGPKTIRVLSAFEIHHYDPNGPGAMRWYDSGTAYRVVDHFEGMGLKQTFLAARASFAKHETDQTIEPDWADEVVKQGFAEYA